MPDLLIQYLPILLFIAIAGAIGLALIAIPFLIAPSAPDPEKLSAYECGFNAFGDARMKFDVRFYLVSILFIIFDLEVAFLFPWAITLRATGPASEALSRRSYAHSRPLHSRVRISPVKISSRTGLVARQADSRLGLFPGGPACAALRRALSERAQRPKRHLELTQ